MGQSTGEGIHATPWATFGTAATDATEFGALVGYGFQVGTWILAPEAQIMLGGGDSHTFYQSAGTSDMALETQDISTASLRVGRAFDRFMVSGSLGFAWVNVDATYATTSTPNPLVLHDQAQGTVFGQAGDHDLGNRWRVRGEYRYFDGLSDSNSDTPYPEAVAPICPARPARMTVRISPFRLFVVFRGVAWSSAPSPDQKFCAGRRLCRPSKPAGPDRPVM